MAIITSVGVLIIVTICNARPPQPLESNSIWDVLRENGVADPGLEYVRGYDQPIPSNRRPNTTTTYRTTTPTSTTKDPYTTTPRPTYPPTTTTTTTYPTPTTPPTTTTPYPTTTITPPPTPRLKLVKKKVITIEDFEAESEL